MKIRYKLLRLRVWEKWFVSSYNIDSTKTILLLFTIVVLVWTAWSREVYLSFLSDDDSKKSSGTLGDSYGIITSFFSALGFAGLLYTLLLQRKELGDTRKEFQKQNTNIKRQRFETTFFNMVQIQLNSVQNIEYVNISTYHGVRALQQFMINFIGSIQQAPNPNLLNVREINYNLRFHENNFDIVSSAFIRSLTATFDMLLNAQLKPRATRRYISIMSAYLSIAEIEFLFFHNLYMDRNELTQRELELLDRFLIQSGLAALARNSINARGQIVV